VLSAEKVKEVIAPPTNQPTARAYATFLKFIWRFEMSVYYYYYYYYYYYLISAYYSFINFRRMKG